MFEVLQSNVGLISVKILIRHSEVCVIIVFISQIKCVMKQLKDSFNN